MKENSKIFKILLRKSSIYHFFVFFPWINKKMQLLQLQLLQLWPPALYVYAISKRIKLGQPARSHLKDLSQSFQIVMDFAMFFSLDESESLKNILFRFFFCAMVTWRKRVIPNCFATSAWSSSLKADAGSVHEKKEQISKNFPLSSIILISCKSNG